MDPWTLRHSIQSSSITLARENFYDPIPYFNVRQCGVCIRDGVEVEVQLQVRILQVRVSKNLVSRW